MYPLDLQLMIVVAVIAAVTQLIKQSMMKSKEDYACYLALTLGLAYSFGQKYIYGQPPETNFIDTLVWGMAIGFAATGGYENIKNILLRGKSVTSNTQNTTTIKELEKPGMP